MFDLWRYAQRAGFLALAILSGGNGGEAKLKEGRGMATVQWSSATSLNRWCSHRPSPPPSRASVPAVSPPRRAKRNGGIGCVSVPRELAAAAEVEQTALPEVEFNTEEGVECEGCSGTGWLLCDFCKGKKNNVKSESSPRIYRRCPTCKAAGYILCPRCRVYRCITFPDSTDS